MTRNSTEESLGKLPWLAGILILLAAGLIGLWHPGEGQKVLSGVEGRLLDMRYHLRGETEPTGNVTIVAIDDRTIDRLERFPLSRADIAEAVDAAAKGGATAIALDLLLLQPGESAVEDMALERMLAEGPPAVIAMTGAFSEDDSGEARLDDLDDVLLSALSRSAFDVVSARGGVPGPAPSRLHLPVSPFARDALLGHVNIVGESDGSLRRLPLDLQLSDMLVLPALPLTAARLHLNLPRGEMQLQRPGGVTLAERRIASDDLATMAIGFHGPPGTIPTYSFIDAVNGDVPADAFRGRLVFIGVTGLGTGDTFATPFSDTLPGVEVLATAADNILGGTELIRGAGTARLDLGLALLAALAAFLAANRANLWLAAGLTLAVWLAALVLLYLAFAEYRVWLDATTLLLAMGVASFGTFAARIFLQKRISSRLMNERQNLARYHSPFLAETLATAARPSFDDRPQLAAVVFVDVAGFTTLSERLGPQGTVAFLRRLHEVFEEAALACGGVIEQFMGDGAMIVFGLPEPGAADSAAALDCGRRLIAAIGKLNSGTDEAIPEPVRIRVSVHYGEVVAAVLGGQTQGHATVAGDVVNVSSRLQEIAKETNSALVVSEAAHDAVAAAGRTDLLEGMARLSGLPIRGREGRIDVWVAGAAS
ncbi:adenylate/guanylate cyclase domain-containing protein [Stappia sp. F7233]|uniref:Adenylate/guanylate cyclase domain-containing protein n=1 Tax=Stappia albiluteola TaxID=2758565 RepID=A0A839ADM1_9HYPH|nr:adenylate/guanylate cyclase domain-containing protein [Stappia albiluteola]MBA5777128.1 adenylate/guanylate cyclase domain-containing protein [Stappia albiluteola]